MLGKSFLLGAFGALLEPSHALRTSLKLPDFRAQMSEEINLHAQDAQLTSRYPEYTLSVPIDHFHNDSTYEPHSNGTFNLRYWFDAQYFKPGGPVIVLQGGETSGEDRLPFLQKGIVAKLAKATNGLGVILEHRYYGTSFPMRDLSIDSLRFLSTDQSVADMAYFAKNVVFDGLERLDLTAPSTPYIAYGGSYAGAFVAFLRKLYPDVYWGAISSSGVTEAIYDYWQYYEAARLFLPQDCVETTQKLINVVDNILLDQNQQGHAQEIKDLFGLGNITRNDDFASAVSVGVTGLQSTNWDPALNSTSVGVYCQNVSSDTPLYSNSHLESKVRKLLVAAGYGDELGTLTTRMLNYIGYIGVRVVSRCGGPSQDECFSNYDSTFYKQDDIKQTWRSWPWQYCTEWGYLQSGSGVPADQLPLISRLIDLNYSSVVCKEAFNITTKPNVESINKHGGFNFSYPRLAIIDGEADPWRAATPHAIGLPSRPNTISEPFLLIEKGVHHWDENGLFANETTEDLPPKSVRDVQNAEVEFVREWIKEWNSENMLGEL